MEIYLQIPARGHHALKAQTPLSSGVIGRNAGHLDVLPPAGSLHGPFNARAVGRHGFPFHGAHVVEVHVHREPREVGEEVVQGDAPG